MSKKTNAAKTVAADATFEIRHHNGQCGYGPWMPDNEACEVYGLPRNVVSEIADDVIETGDDAGSIIIGGNRWLWRAV